ncbi:hypothetical protein PHYSODRAFT_477273 [Phytophthora sojae]|uniref:Uncharacterized protein n=1 Tax=Phytophthora sojae (strain P6497) TaxID=1094619 RepID=G4YM44_PHYSP|nr:hypothetical protein PHYSODRAFT_477273 [Phytophthora sojae]EGZ27852.1 hypothetical protein PHYSODRAFT_477273 [Phytophthora sojae]|eukprot:XP_009515127.1 hypothetical protein PHYSODRAFT_477273 [Phytophthora sojae]
MCRSMSAQTLQSQHLVAKDDSVGVIFVKTKTNQEGSGPRDPLHLYANPLSPSTCWVTALAIYLACHPRLEPGALFPGSNQKLQFSKVLTNLLKQGDAGKSYGTQWSGYIRLWRKYRWSLDRECVSSLRMEPRWSSRSLFAL